MPWLFWASDRRPRPARAAAGRPAGAGRRLRPAGRARPDERRTSCSRRACMPPGRRASDARRELRAGRRPGRSGSALGLAIAAVEIVPLWVYLGKSPVWADRERERPSPWPLTRPRVLDAVCTAVPYAFGSQRRGQPNLARAVGVHNLNESAGGFAGLATLIWLAPLAWLGAAAAAAGRVPRGPGGVRAPRGVRVPAGRQPAPRVPVLERDRQPPAHALGRLRPGAAGRDRARPARRPAGPRSGRAGGSLGRPVAALPRGGRRRSGPSPGSAPAPWRITPGPAEATAGRRPRGLSRRAERQVRQALDLPAPTALAHGRGTLGPGRAGGPGAARVGAMAVGAAGLARPDAGRPVGFGYGLNPAIDPADDRPVTAADRPAPREARPRPGG